MHYVISGFRREADEICALLGYYAAFSGSYVSTFRDIILVQVFSTLEEGTDILSRNVGAELQLSTTYYTRRTHISPEMHWLPAVHRDQHLRVKILFNNNIFIIIQLNKQLFARRFMSVLERFTKEYVLCS
jgi:hypothetical protein